MGFESHGWNFNRLGSILDNITSDYGLTIGGVTTPYLYFGMWKSTFAWHTEDMDLCAINYMHLGAPKVWFTIPPSHARKFEELARKHFVASNQNCSAFLRHKTTIIHPKILLENNIPYSKVNKFININQNMPSNGILCKVLIAIYT